MFFKALNDAEICSKSALGLYPSTGPSIQTGGTPKGWVCAITNTQELLQPYRVNAIKQMCINSFPSIDLTF